MKILVCIANYGQENIGYLKIVLQEYNTIGITESVLVCVDTTVELKDLTQYGNIQIVQRMFDPSIRQNLVFEHRSFMKDNLDQYDLFIYTENDILITWKNIRAFVDFSGKLPQKYLLGFVRYEKLSGRNEKFFIDFGKKGFHLPIVRQVITIDGEVFFEPTNIHQACFLMTREQLSTILKSGYSNVFLRKPSAIAPEIGLKHVSFGYGVLEAGASDVFHGCGFTKIISLKNLETLLIHHLPDKYCRIFHGKNELDSIVTSEDMKDFHQLARIGLSRRLFCTIRIVLRYIRISMSSFR